VRQIRTLRSMRRGLETRFTVGLLRHSQRKRGATDRPDLRNRGASPRPYHGRRPVRGDPELEDANIKLDSVISNVTRVSGRKMIEALIGGETDPQALAALADGRLHATKEELEAALRGRVTAHHRFMLRLHLHHLDAVDAALARIDQEVEGNLEPFRVACELLTSIPGVSSLTAEVRSLRSAST